MESAPNHPSIAPTRAFRGFCAIERQIAPGRSIRVAQSTDRQLTATRIPGARRFGAEASIRDVYAPHKGDETSRIAGVARFGPETPAPRPRRRTPGAERRRPTHVPLAEPKPRRHRQPTPELNATNNTLSPYDAIHDHAPRTWLAAAKAAAAKPPMTFDRPHKQTSHNPPGHQVPHPDRLRHPPHNLTAHYA